MPEGPLFSVAYVAARLGLSRSSVYSLIRSGALAALRLRPGRRGAYRIEPAQLDAYLAGRRSEAQGVGAPVDPDAVLRTMRGGT